MTATGELSRCAWRQSWTAGHVDTNIKGKRWRMHLAKFLLGGRSRRTWRQACRAGHINTSIKHKRWRAQLAISFLRQVDGAGSSGARAAGAYGDAAQGARRLVGHG